MNNGKIVAQESGAHGPGSDPSSDRAILPAVSTVAAALVGVVGIWLAVKSLRQSSQAAQVQALSEVFSQIRDLEFIYQREYSDRPEQDKRFWDYQFFNTVEYLCFLVNHRLVRHRELTDFFRTGIIRWYEEMFVKNLPEAVENPTVFQEFKSLYRRLKTPQA